MSLTPQMHNYTQYKKKKKTKNNMQCDTIKQKKKLTNVS